MLRVFAALLTPEKPGPSLLALELAASGTFYFWPSCNAYFLFCCFLGYETLIFWFKEQYCDLFNRSGLLSLLVAKNSSSEPETINWEETMGLLHSFQHHFFFSVSGNVT